MRILPFFLLVLAGLGLSGCYLDPLQNPADWAMNGAPLENTAQMVSDKSELIQGHGDPSSNGVAAAAAVDVAIGGSAGTAAGLQKPPPPISFTSGTGN
jgi:hypothetical protein